MPIKSFFPEQNLWNIGQLGLSKCRNNFLSVTKFGYFYFVQFHFCSHWKTFSCFDDETFFPCTSSHAVLKEIFQDRKVLSTNCLLLSGFNQQQTFFIEKGLSGFLKNSVQVRFLCCSTTTANTLISHDLTMNPVTVTIEKYSTKEWQLYTKWKKKCVQSLFFSTKYLKTKTHIFWLWS
jgi:hypothetical protein